VGDHGAVAEFDEGLGEGEGEGAEAGAEAADEDECCGIVSWCEIYGCWWAWD